MISPIRPASAQSIRRMPVRPAQPTAPAAKAIAQAPRTEHMSGLEELARVAVSIGAAPVLGAVGAGVGMLLRGRGVLGAVIGASAVGVGLAAKTLYEIVRAPQGYNNGYRLGMAGLMVLPAGLAVAGAAMFGLTGGLIGAAAPIALVGAGLALGRLFR